MRRRLAAATLGTLFLFGAWMDDPADYALWCPVEPGHVTPDGYPAHPAAVPPDARNPLPPRPTRRPGPPGTGPHRAPPHPTNHPHRFPPTPGSATVRNPTPAAPHSRDPTPAPENRATPLP